MIPTIVGKVWKTGNSYVVTIPTELIRTGLVRPTKDYNITLTHIEVNNEPDNRKNND